MLDFRIYTFLKLCDTMNYRITAESLNMTQPAVTQQIHFLEREYNCKLFCYDGKKLIKTNKADILERYARAALYNETALEKELSNKFCENLRIGATKTIGDFVITSGVEGIIKSNNYDFSLMVDNTENLLKLLRDNLLDFALIEGIFDKGYYGYKLFRNEPFVGICNKNHPFANRSVPLLEILKETVILREEGSGTRAILEQILEEKSLGVKFFKNVICISSFEMIKKLVKDNCGISFVYAAVAKSDTSLSTFTIENTDIKREFNFVFLKNTNADTKVSEFLKFR